MNLRKTIRAITTYILWSVLPLSVGMAMPIAPSCLEGGSSSLSVKLSSPKSIDQGLTLISDSNKKLVVFGEGHAWGEWKHIPEIAKSLRDKDSDFNCLFLELDNQDYVDKLLDEYSKHRQEGFDNILAAKALRKAGWLTETSSSLTENIITMRIHRAIIELNQYGYKIIAADNPSPDGDPSTEFSTVMADSRDKHMAEVVEKNFKNGNCKRGLFPVGVAHITLLTDGPRRTLKQRLNAQSTIYASLLKTGKSLSDEKHPVWGFNSCLAANELDKPIAFDSDGLDQNMPMYYGLYGSWADFDWHFVYPGGHK